MKKLCIYLVKGRILARREKIRLSGGLRLVVANVSMEPSSSYFGAVKMKTTGCSETYVAI